MSNLLIMFLACFDTNSFTLHIDMIIIFCSFALPMFACALFITGSVALVLVVQLWVLSSTLGSWIRHFGHVPVSNTCLIWVCIEYGYKHVTYPLHIRGQTNNFFYSRYGRDTTGTYRIVPPHFFLSISVSLFFAFRPVVPPHFFLAFLSLGLSVLCVFT